MSRLKSVNAVLGMTVALMMVLGTSAVASARTVQGTAVHHSCNITIWDFYPSVNNDNERQATLAQANAWTHTSGGHGCTVTEPIQPSGGYETPFINNPQTAGDIIMLPDDQEGVVWNDKLLAQVPLNQKAYAPDALGGVINGGKAYAYPLFLETMMIYYNPKLIPASTFKGSYTWNKVAAAGKACVSSHKCQYGMAWQWDNVYYDAQFFQSYKGGGFFKKTATGFNSSKVLVNNSATVKGVNYLKSIIGASGTDLNTFLGANSGDSTAQSLFETGKLGMIDDGPWSDGEWKQANFKDYAVAAPPAFPNGKKTTVGVPFVGVQDLVVNKFSKNVKKSESLASYLSLHTKSLYAAGGRIPAAKSVFNSLPKTPEVKAYKSALNHVQAMPNIPKMGAVWAPVGAELTLILQGKETAQAGMTKAATAIKKAKV